MVTNSYPGGHYSETLQDGRKDELKPEAILDWRMRHLVIMQITDVLVNWKDTPIEGSAWKSVEAPRLCFNEGGCYMQGRR